MERDTKRKDTSPGPPSLRVLLCDTEWQYRDALVAHLRGYPDLDIVTAADGTPSRGGAVDVAFVDLDLDGHDPAGLVREAAGAAPGAGIVAFTASTSASTFREALAAGARGYLLKQEPNRPEVVADAIHAVASGGTYFQAESLRMLEEMARRSGGTQPFNLTARELQILDLLTGGLSNRQIGDRLSITEQAVKNHLRRMYPKLGVTNRTAAALLAHREGLGPKGSPGPHSAES